MPAQRAEIRGKGGVLKGRCRRFKVTTVHDWQDTEDGAKVCGEADQVLQTIICFDETLKPRAARQKHYRMILAEQVQVLLTNTSFTGYVIASEWEEFFDLEGEFTGATLELTVRGREK